MRTLHVIGIGAGSPAHLTLEAVEAMRSTEVFLLLGKKGAADELTDAREALVARFAPQARVVRRRDAVRDRGAADYRGAVADWRTERVELYEALLRDEVLDGGVAALLVWGDPALYDSTITVVEEVAARGEVAITWTVVPGISAVAALTAAHRIPLNRIGGTVLVAPARRIADGLPDDADDVVVMLDAHDSYATLPGAEDLDIYWGAYLGTPDEILLAGPLPAMAERIRATRAQARAAKGWIMDTYLLRRRRSSGRLSE